MEQLPIGNSLPHVGLLEACDDSELFAIDLWPRQREILAAIESGDHRLLALSLGRRSGKTTMAALTMLWSCLLRPELRDMVRPGERFFSVGVATNVRQARLLVMAARSIVEASPLLAPMIESATEDELRFSNGSALTAFPCSSRGGRGWPIATLVFDELAHFLSETDGFQTAERVWSALVPATAQFGSHARLIASSTPFGTEGLFAQLYNQAESGDLEDARAFCVPSWEMNPTLDARTLELEERRDPDGFSAEYGAQFTGSGDSFIDFDRVEVVGVPIAARDQAVSWVAGLDPAFSRDPFGLALVGRTSDDRLVVGPVRALRPEGEFAGPIDEAAEVVRAYGARIVTDQFSSAAVVDRLRNVHGLQIAVNTMTATSKTAIFQELRTRLYDGSLVLPDHADLIAECRRLRTRFSAGSAAILNPRVGGSHGDLAQALALAAYELRGSSPVVPDDFDFFAGPPQASQWLTIGSNDAPTVVRTRRLSTSASRSEAAEPNFDAESAGVRKAWLEAYPHGQTARIQYERSWHLERAQARRDREQGRRVESDEPSFGVGHQHGGLDEFSITDPAASTYRF